MALGSLLHQAAVLGFPPTTTPSPPPFIPDLRPVLRVSILRPTRDCSLHTKKNLGAWLL